MEAPELAALIETIIARGFAKDDELKRLTSEHPTRVERSWSEDKDERYWVFVLDDTHFVFCGWPLVWMGAPRNIVGMVGVYDMVGGERVTNHEKTRHFFMNVAGQAAIEYWRGLVASQPKEDDKS